jgi:lipid-binding SYLF domain-containing protein
MPRSAEEKAQAKAEIDAALPGTLDTLYAEIPGSREAAADAAGILVFPDVVKGGIGLGGEYGRGALQVGGRTVDYYSLSGGSLGIQLGAERRSVVFLFMTEDALKSFQDSSGWTAGADASVAIPDTGTGGKLSSAAANQPVVAYVFGQSGLMFNASLEGARIAKIDLA